MQKLGLKFRVVDSGYREHHHKHLKPRELVKFLALGKARKAALKYPNAIVIAADTVVAFNQKILGKPKNKKDAYRTLNSLNGKINYVLTGMIVLDGQTGKIFQISTSAKVVFKKNSDSVIGNYINSGEPMDKAGSYAIFGRGLKLVKKIVGDRDAAIGLPLKDLKKVLKKLGSS